MMETVELQDRVGSVVGRNPYLSGGNLRFEASHGRVVIQGTVRSYYQKQMAQEAVRGIEGVDEVENRLEVDWER